MRTPPDPNRVLLVAALLPGMGHVWTGRVRRGFGFALFALLGGWLTARFAASDVSFVGRHAGGFFVWALSVTDAYRGARLNTVRFARDAQSDHVGE